MNQLYLASRSPRRREILAQMGVHFLPLVFRSGPRSDEGLDETPLPKEAPDAYVERVTRAKVTCGLHLLKQRNLIPLPVLSADTILDLDGRIIGKPANDEEAHSILEALSGRKHRVLSGVAVSNADQTSFQLVSSEVTFRTLSAEEIRRYLLTGEHQDKAGAYGIQGRAGMFVSHISGSYTGIMGLPVCETAVILKSFGFVF